MNATAETAFLRLNFHRNQQVLGGQAGVLPALDLPSNSSYLIETHAAEQPLEEGTQEALNNQYAGQY